jgi:hypothetical protein
MTSIDRSTRRTASSLAAAALGGLLAFMLAGCGAAATPNPAASAIASAPGVAASPAAASVAAAPSTAAAPASPVGNGAAGVKDPCSLLTPAEISAAVGYRVSSGKLNASGNACLWPGQTAIGAQLVIGTGGADAFKVQAAFPMTGGSQPLSGIGDEAAQSTGTEAVAFRKGDIVVTISATDATTGAAAVLAKLIVDRL